MVPGSWQNPDRRETLSTQVQQEIYNLRSAKYEFTILKNKKKLFFLEKEMATHSSILA